MTLALLALPFAYVFGTNTNLWSGAGRGAPLWLAALAVATGAGTTPRRAHHSASRAPRPEVAADAIDEHADEAATAPTRTSVSTASRTTPRASTPIPTPEPQEPAAVAGTARPGRADPPPALPPSPPGDTAWRAAPPWAARAGLPLLAATALVGGVTTAAADSYYRYPMPGPGTVTGVVDAAGHRLRLTPRDARDSSALAAAATKGAEAPDGTRVDVAGRDVLDTTGASPGYIWQLGGRALGSDWLIGGYRGSDAAAAHALSLVGCERISQALVLDAPDSPRRIDGLWTLLRRDPERDYRPILTWRHQLGYEVRLLAPTPDAPAVSCPTG